MRALIAGMLMLTAVGCHGRKATVQQQSGPRPAATVTLHFTNNSSQAVNVYVVAGGTELLLKQVAANSTEDLPVRNVSAGASVTLKATESDGVRTYTSKPLVAATSFVWQVP
jgi:Flp pilus assembly protein CpaB